MDNLWSGGALCERGGWPPGPGMSVFRKHRRSKLNATFALIGLVALLCRAIIPAGYMPSQAAGHGAPTLVICGGHGTADLSASIDHNLGTDSGKAPKAPATHPPCLFSGLTALAGSQLDLASAPEAYGIASPPPRQRQATSEPALAAPPPWPTGPPALA